MNSHAVPEMSDSSWLDYIISQGLTPDCVAINHKKGGSSHFYFVPTNGGDAGCIEFEHDQPHPTHERVSHAIHQFLHQHFPFRVQAWKVPKAITWRIDQVIIYADKTSGNFTVILRGPDHILICPLS
jgi:hypothetical protein